MFSNWSIGRRGTAAAGILLLLLGLTASAVRIVVRYQTPGPPDGVNEGYCDFHNGIYFPSVALVEGVSPYGSEYAASYPVSRQIPFFSPAIVAIHTPLTFLPLYVAEVLYFAIMVVLVIGIAVQSITAAGLERRLDWVLLLAAAITFSRAGHVTLFNGYFTFELVFAAILAVRLAGPRPWLAALALVVVSAKPTYVLPLGLLMLARGNYKSLIYGALLSIAAAAMPLAWLAWNEGQGDIPRGLLEIRQQITDAQEVHHNEPNELPALSWTRIDIFAIVSKWSDTDPDDVTHLVVMVAILALPMLILYRRSRLGIDDGIAGLTGALIMIAMIVSLYRQSYDVLLCVPVFVGVIAGRLDAWRSLSRFKRTAIALFIVFPAYNYLSTQMVLGRFDLSTEFVKVLTSLNAVALLCLLIWLCLIAWRLPGLLEQNGEYCHLNREKPSQQNSDPAEPVRLV